VTTGVGSEDELVPWSSEEELLVCRKQEDIEVVSIFARLRPVVLFVSACLLSVGVVNTMKSTASVARNDVGSAKFIV